MARKRKRQSTPIPDHAWWIVKRNDGVIGFTLGVKDVDELRIEGVQHTGVSSLARIKPKAKCARPSYLNAFLQYPGQDDAVAFQVKIGSFAPNFSSPPFNSTEIFKTVYQLDSFIDFCDNHLNSENEEDQQDANYGSGDEVTSSQQQQKITEDEPTSSVQQQKITGEDEPTSSQQQQKILENDEMDHSANHPAEVPISQPMFPNTDPPDSPVVVTSDEEIVDRNEQNTNTKKKKVKTADAEKKKRNRNAKDGLAEYGDGDVSDFSDTELKKPKVTSDLDKEKTRRMAKKSKSQIVDEKNVQFQKRVRPLICGKFSGCILHLKSAHDSEKKIFVDRAIDRNHVNEIKQSARDFPGRALTSGSLLGIYDGTAKEFQARNLEISQGLLMKANKKKSHKGYSGATVQTAVDDGNILIIGGLHRLTAFTELVEENNNDEVKIKELYGSSVYRVVVTVYATKWLDESNEVIHTIDDADIARLSREHNSMPASMPKSCCDYLQCLRRFALLHAGLPTEGYARLTANWKRSDTDASYETFVDSEFPKPCTVSQRGQYLKAKQLIEMDPARFEDIVWIYDGVRKLSVDFFPVEHRLQPDGTSVRYFYDPITVANFIAPLAGLADTTRDALIVSYRQKWFELFKTVEEADFGTMSQVKAIVATFKKKCTNERARAVFFSGFCEATRVPFTELKSQFGPWTKRETYGPYLKDFTKFFLKKPTLKDMPPTWTDIYKSAIEYKMKLDHSNADLTPNDNVNPDTCIIGDHSVVVRDSSLRAVSMLDTLSFNRCVLARPPDVQFFGISTVIFHRLSERNDVPSLLNRLHNDLTGNRNSYTIISLGDSTDDLLPLVAGSRIYQHWTLMVDNDNPPSAESLNDRFGYYNQFDHVVILVHIRSAKLDRPEKRTNPTSTYYSGQHLFAMPFLKSVIELVTAEKNSWVLDCCLVANEQFTISKALLCSALNLHVFVQSIGSLTQICLKDYARELQVHRKLVRGETRSKGGPPQHSESSDLLPDDVVKYSIGNFIGNSDFNSDADIIYCGLVPLPVPPFSPVTASWQRSKGELFRLEGGSVALSTKTRGAVLRGSIPLKLYKVDCDGNGLMKSLSAAVTGSPEHHSAFRLWLCQFVQRNYDTVKCLVEEPQEDYVHKMMRPAVNAENVDKWGTDREVFLFSNILQTDIYVFMADYDKPVWLRFKTNTINGIKISNFAFPYTTDVDRTASTYQAIYLQNKHNHFDLVVEVLESGQLEVDNDNMQSTKDIVTANSQELVRTERDTTNEYSAVPTDSGIVPATPEQSSSRIGNKSTLSLESSLGVSLTDSQKKTVDAIVQERRELRAYSAAHEVLDVRALLKEDGETSERLEDGETSESTEDGETSERLEDGETSHEDIGKENLHAAKGEEGRRETLQTPLDEVKAETPKTPGTLAERPKTPTPGTVDQDDVDFELDDRPKTPGQIVDNDVADAKENLNPNADKDNGVHMEKLNNRDQEVHPKVLNDTENRITNDENDEKSYPPAKKIRIADTVEDVEDESDEEMFNYSTSRSDDQLGIENKEPI